MVLLDNGKFLTELHKLYEANKGPGTVWVTMKRSEGRGRGVGAPRGAGRGAPPASTRSTAPLARLLRPDRSPQAT